jgi:hypothetical protein
VLALAASAPAFGQAPSPERQKRRWKVMVLVPETHIARPRIPDPAVETELSKELIDAGYKVLDQGRIAELRYSQVLDRILKGGDPAKVKLEVIQLGRKFGADVLVTGEAFTTVYGQGQRVETDLGAVTKIRCAARVELKAIRMDTGEKFYADSVAEHVGPGASSEELSSKACLEEAAADIASSLLEKMDKLALTPTQTVEVHIRGIGSAARGRELEEALSKSPGVRDVSPGDMDGDTYEMELEVDRSAVRNLASLLETAPSLKRFKLKVQSASGSRIIANAH